MTNLPAEGATPAAVIAALERATALVQEADSLDQVIEYRAEATAIEAVVRQRNMGRSMERQATALRVRTERRLGQLLEEERAAGRLARGRPGESVNTLHTFGLERHEAADFKRLAELPDEEFDAALVDLPTLSRRSVINLAIANRPRADRPVRHPAPFSDPIAEAMIEVLRGYRKVLDPFAGIGRIHAIAEAAGCESVGIELEPEWAAMGGGNTLIGDARKIATLFNPGDFDAICTSPTYGNRMADHHQPTDLHSHRRSYTFDLGRPLTEGNAGALQWGDEYRAFHEEVWAAAVHVLAPGGRFVLNISDHVRDHDRMPVTMFHLMTLVRLGLDGYDLVPIPTSRLRDGQNYDARVPVEYLVIFDKPD